MPAPKDLPLSQLTVLDLTHHRSGPVCVRHLADWGAKVIYIEPPGTEGEDAVGGRRHGPDFQNLHRNKRMLKLNLKSQEGRDAFMRLVKQADVVVENMRPSVKNRLGIAWDDVRKVNPRIVYGSISGFGQKGPYAERPGVDQIAQGMGGLMSITGHPGQGPIRVGIAINDVTAGNLLALAIMMALFKREKTGEGSWVHTSLLEAQIFMLDFQAARYLANGEVAQQEGNDHPTGTPTGVYPTSDGHINIAAANNRMWARLCDTLNKPDWKAKPEWATSPLRTKDRAGVTKAISDITRAKPSAYWIELLAEKEVPVGPIYSVDQVFADQQVQGLGMVTHMDHPVIGEMDLVASALNFDGYAKNIRIPTRDAGADSDDILKDAGFSPAEIADLHAKGAV